jgi:hypothetical protein
MIGRSTNLKVIEIKKTKKNKNKKKQKKHQKNPTLIYLNVHKDNNMK